MEHHLVRKGWLEPLKGLSWDNLATASNVAIPILRELGENKRLLLDSLDSVIASTELRKRCESDGFFDRVILYEDTKKQFSIRLQSLQAHDHHRPHNHRAPFATILLLGTYEHALYPDVRECFQGRGPIETDISELLETRPTLVTNQTAWSSYVIGSRTLHSTIANSDHLSLVVRGPSELRRLLFIEPKIKAAQWMYGGVDETEKQLSEKRMSNESFEKMRALLESL